METENREAIDTEIQELRRKITVSENAKKLLRLGCSEFEAISIAGHMYGAKDFDSALAEIQSLFADNERRLKTAMRSQGSGAIGYKAVTITHEQFAKMGYSERLKLHQSDPDEYERLAGR